MVDAAAMNPSYAIYYSEKKICDFANSLHYLGEAIETYTIPGLISMKWDEITESPDSLGRAVGRMTQDIILAVIAKNMEMEAKANAGKKVYEGNKGTSWAELMLPEDAEKYNHWVDLRETGLDHARINDIVITNKGYRPDPATYLSQEYIDAHLELFSDGAVKISATTPIGQAGPPGGTFVMPKSVADEIIREANGNVSKLEQLLSLEPRTLGDSPVRLDIVEPQGLRMPSGNELGANEQWVLGGSTKGGIPEATLDSPLQGEFVSTPIFE